MQEGLKEWIIMDDENLKFHMNQYEKPYRSTVKFLEYLKSKVKRTGNVILDLGCGAGAVLGYLLQDKRIFEGGVGVDINKYLVEEGNRILMERNITNCELWERDFNELKKTDFRRVDGIISLQTFNILPNYYEIVQCMCRLEPNWIAFTTLGFEGLIDYEIRLHDYTKNKDGDYTEVFYNIYSLPKMKEYFENLGYSKFDYKEFDIDIDLPQTNKMGRGTYTIKMEQGKRMQISGGLMMPWYFVFVER